MTMSTVRPETCSAPRRVLPRERWPLAVGFSGIWLVFLLTAVAVAAHDLALAGDGARVVVLLGAALAFVVVYLTAFVAPRPVPSWTRTTTLSAYSGVLTLLTALMYAAAGPAALNAIPYLAAVWVFGLPRNRAALVGAGIGGLGLLMVALTVPDGERLPFLFGIGIALVMIIVVRLTTDREDTLRATDEALQLALQREQLGRDVHDVVGHSLTAVHVKAQLLRRLIDLDPARARAEANEIIALTRSALGEVRATVDGLAAPELGPEMARARRTLADAGVRLAAPSPDAVAALPRETAGLYAWVLREAVTNVLRHADARTVHVTLTPRSLAVVDDGVGPDAARAAAEPGRTGHGLHSMRARVARDGGTLTLTPAHLGRARPGTRLEVTL